jgi:hypothetical protein
MSMGVLMWRDEPRPVRLEVCRGYGQTNYKRQLAYERLGISQSDVQILPFFEDQLKRIARRVNWGAQQTSALSPAEPLEYLRSSEDPDARKVLAAYLSVPKSYRRLLPPEAFCRAAGVSPWHVLRCITVVAVWMGATGATIVAAVLQPRVVEKLIDTALSDANDRHEAAAIVLRGSGFLPSRR